MKLQKERELQKVRDAARQRVTQARLAARRPLMRRLFEQLDKAVTIAEELRDYDDRTQALGASSPECPCPELLPGWSSDRENIVTYRKRRFADWLT